MIRYCNKCRHAEPAHFDGKRRCSVGKLTKKPCRCQGFCGCKSRKANGYYCRHRAWIKSEKMKAHASPVRPCKFFSFCGNRVEGGLNKTRCFTCKKERQRNYNRGYRSIQRAQ